MNKRQFSVVLQRTWRIARRVFWMLILGVFIIAWLLVGGFNLYCAVQLTCNNVSLTWWSMFISVVSLPALVVQIYLLRKTIEDSWKPNLSIGISSTAMRPDAIMRLDELPDHIIIDYRSITNAKRMFIRNQGKAAAKSVKIQITVVEYPPQPSAPVIQLNNAKHISGIPVVIAEPDTLIHPGDYHEFVFDVKPDMSDKYSGVFKLISRGISYIKNDSKILKLRRIREESRVSNNILDSYCSVAKIKGVSDGCCKPTP